MAAVTRVASYGKPLERDAANYLYVGSLFHGVMPYKSAATNKGPATYRTFGPLDVLLGPRTPLVAWELWRSESSGRLARLAAAPRGATAVAAAAVAYLVVGGA